MRSIIETNKAPKSIGTYSQAILVGKMLYISGQIGLDPVTCEMKVGFEEQLIQVLNNLKVIAQEAGGDLNKAVKLNVFLTDLNNFAKVNDIMSKSLKMPYPARAAVQVSRLPKDAEVEIDAILYLD